MCICDPNTTAFIFASDKMVVTGEKSEDDSRLASREYRHIVQKLGFDAKFSEFKIQTIVGSCDVKLPIHLEGLAYGHRQFSSYESKVCLRPYTLFCSFINCFQAVPRFDLSHDRAACSGLHVRKDCARWHEGNSISRSRWFPMVEFRRADVFFFSAALPVQ